MTKKTKGELIFRHTCGKTTSRKQTVNQENQRQRRDESSQRNVLSQEHENCQKRKSKKNVESLSPILHIEWYLNPQRKQKNHISDDNKFNMQAL